MTSHNYRGQCEYHYGENDRTDLRPIQLTHTGRRADAQGVVWVCKPCRDYLRGKYVIPKYEKVLMMQRDTFVGDRTKPWWDEMKDMDDAKKLIVGESPLSLAGVVALLIREGHMIPVEIFGAAGENAETHCSCGKELPEWGYGVSDRFSTHAPGGSDCNRADVYMLRPSDALMETTEIKAALRDVLEDDDERLHER